jgi:GNAT superfamily N-acetyltransferase
MSSRLFAAAKEISADTLCRQRQECSRVKAVIRDFERQDQVDVRDLILQGLREHWGSIDPQYNSDLDDMSASYGHGTTLVASRHDRVIGTGTIVPITKATAEIVRMSVALDHRQSGLGRTLVHALVDEARARGHSRVILETATHWTGAVEFYKRCGFVVTHEVDGAFCRDTCFEMLLE